jgi:hypothetical protein
MLAPSRFLQDIETELLRQQDAVLPRAKPQDRQLSLF